MKCDVCEKKLRKNYGKSGIRLCRSCSKLPFSSVYERIGNLPSPKSKVKVKKHKRGKK